MSLGTSSRNILSGGVQESKLWRAMATASENSKPLRHRLGSVWVTKTQVALDGDVSLEIESGVAGDFDAIAEELAEEIAAAGRNLARAERGFAELVRPVRNEGTVRGAGNGIFRDAFGRREEAGDEIAIRAGGSSDYRKAIDMFESLHVRGESTYFFG